MIDIAVLGVSLVALVVAAISSVQSTKLARNSNALPVVVDLFREHRGERLASAREFVQKKMAKSPPDTLEDLPRTERLLVQDLAWFYDNLGALIEYKIVDPAPAIGYLGGSVVDTWKVLGPLIEKERDRRDETSEPHRYQMYFERLAARAELERAPETDPMLDAPDSPSPGT